jgi:pectate lyase
LQDQSARDAYAAVLKSAGAILPKRDKVDERIIQETKSGTAIGKGSFGKAGIIDDVMAVGGWGEYQSQPAPSDTDGDGMPDEWEKSNGLNPSDAGDRNKLDKSGYTMLENYLNSLTAIK